MLGDTRIVAGEIGAGELALRVPPVIGAPGKAIVYGHGRKVTFPDAGRTPP